MNVIIITSLATTVKWANDLVNTMSRLGVEFTAYTASLLLLVQQKSRAQATENLPTTPQ